MIRDTSTIDQYRASFVTSAVLWLAPRSLGCIRDRTESFTTVNDLVTSLHSARQTQIWFEYNSR